MKVPSEREATLPRPITHSKVLVAEGATPLNFLDALVRQLDLDDEIEIRSFGGITNLRTYLRTIAADPGFTQVTSFGIVRDSEDDPDAAAQSIASAVEAAKFPPTVRVQWTLLPDSKSAGMIETLCLRSVNNDPVYQCTDAFFQCLKGKGIAVQDGIKCHKHYAWVYMAGRDCPEIPVGIAAHRKIWPFDDPAFDELKSFIRSL